MAHSPLTMQPQIPDAPWMQGAKEIEGHEMLVVHMTNGELEGLDNLQGGPSVDPETGIREYSALADIIKIPEIQELFHHVRNEIEQHGEISDDLKKVYHYAKEHSLPYRETPEEEHDPIHAIEHTGRGGDTKMALIPLDLAFFLIELRHVPSINPKTGLLEFGFFDKLFSGKNPFKGWENTFSKKRGYGFKDALRAAGTIGGAMIGGPMGAGIGNALGYKLGGSDWGDSLGAGVKTGLMTYGAQGIGQAAGLGASTPYTAGFFGGAPNLVAQGLGSLGIGSAAGTGAAAAGTGATAAGTGGWSQIGAGGVALPTMGPTTAASSGILGSLGSTMAAHPLLTAGGLGAAYLGLTHMGEKRNVKEQRKRQEEHEQKERERLKEMGFTHSWSPVSAREMIENPDYYEITPYEREMGVYQPPKHIYEKSKVYATGGLVKSYSKGTLVKGKGKGQDDTIKTSVPDGSYIIDASSTSMLGDGSSSAGADILKEFENKIKNKFPKHFTKNVEQEVKKNAKQVPVWLSNDEYKFDPLTVTLLGKGSNEKGAAFLKQMVINLRKHKISKGHGLPPKAKDISSYIPNRSH